MTTAMAVLIGWERASRRKLLGIGVAFGGAAFMVLYGQSVGAQPSALAGNVLFFFNCLGSSVYVMLSKPLVQCGRYSYLSVTAWAYLFGACFSVATACAVASNPAALHFVAPDIGPSQAWHVPSSAYFSAENRAC